MKEFNMITIGVGGQGILTMMRIIAEAALKQKYDVKTSELHGLSQRGGSVPCHIRFGKKIYSPLVMEGEAHLIMALEPLEALRACYFGSKENETTFLVNNYRITPISVPIYKEKYPCLTKIFEDLRDFSSRLFVINASEIVKREVGSIVPTNIYMLGYAISKELIPLKRKNIIQSIGEIVPEKYLEINRKIFEMGESAAKSHGEIEVI
jgi:indolepyruvate ferredoxin oxidoreductase beta subunit